MQAVNEKNTEILYAIDRYRICDPSSLGDSRQVRYPCHGRWRSPRGFVTGIIKDNIFPLVAKVGSRRFVFVGSDRLSLGFFEVLVHTAPYAFSGQLFFKDSPDLWILVFIFDLVATFAAVLKHVLCLGKREVVLPTIPPKS